MAAPRLRHVTTRRELEGVRDDFITQGYEVLSEGQTSLLMRKQTWGTTGLHVVIALLTVWWTLGLANLIYGIVAHQTADQILVKLDVPDDAPQLQMPAFGAAQV